MLSVKPKVGDLVKFDGARARGVMLFVNSEGTRTRYAKDNLIDWDVDPIWIYCTQDDTGGLVHTRLTDKQIMKAGVLIGNIHSRMVRIGKHLFEES